MCRVFKLPNCKIGQSQNSSRGYILIALMLAVALIAIGLLTVLPDLGFQIRRDREQEMIHRGCAYARAVQRYYRKFGRYPTRVEELENTNNIRFLRKRYKDPLTGKDFKILRMTDVALNNGPVLGQGLPGQGLAGQGARVQGLPGQGFGQGMPGANPVPISGGVVAAGGLNANAAQNAASIAPTGDNQRSASAEGASGSTGDSGSSEASNASSTSSGSSGNLGSNSQVFGGGPILGVASLSKEKTIREFNNKNHYKDWLFIYDPSSDRGGLITRPWQQDLTNRGFGGVNPNQVGQAGQAVPGQTLPSSPPAANNPPGGAPNPIPEQSPPDQ